MGEVRVLIHKGLRLTQSGVMLHYLSDLLGKYGGRDEAEKREIWRWILFDNHNTIGVIKRIFGFTKVCYRGIAKNAHRFFVPARSLISSWSVGHIEWCIGDVTLP